MGLKNILIKGAHGTGKTYLARAMAYFICKENINPKDVKNEEIITNIKEIDEFIKTDYVEFIQIHPALSYEDIVYGIEIKASNSLTLQYVSKRIKSICDRAYGKTEKYCVILDDTDRADMGTLLGNLIYAMEYRDEEIKLADGNTLRIPENLYFIATESVSYIQNKIDYALLRRFTYIEELSSNRESVKRYYENFIKEPILSDIILDIYDFISTSVKERICEDLRENVNNYIPGHGMYMVACGGLSVYEILRNFKYKLEYQLKPFLCSYIKENIIEGNIEDIWDTVMAKINIGLSDSEFIITVEKVKSTDNSILPFSLSDTKNYLETDILAKMPNSSDLRGIIESVIDAIWLNGILSNDIVFHCLLTNTNIVRFTNRSDLRDHAAYIVESHRIGYFGYKTTNSNSMRSYYSTNRVRTGRWQSLNCAPMYKLTDKNGNQSFYSYLNALRNVGFNPSSPIVHAVENTASIFESVYRLINWYYKVYIQELYLRVQTETILLELYKFALIEAKYWELVLYDIGSVTGSPEKLKRLVESILKLHLLWTKSGNDVIINATRFNYLSDNIDKMVIENYDELFNVSSGKSLAIRIEGVTKMADLTNYQDIMDRIEVRQMIFQGPPGTSKTFETKKFVLSQLDNAKYESLSGCFSQQNINDALKEYKLSEDDYNDPLNSTKLKSGGWDIVQFHPSYGYEDFVRGIEVKPGAGGVPTYNNINRLLGKVAEFAEVAEGEAINSNQQDSPKFYLIIDEINRANLATVFGELIYGLEYRENPISTPYEVNKVTGENTKDIVLKNNLYIIGTMNTADKSIDGIDYAIRRRFIFIDSPANREVIENSHRNVMEIAHSDVVESIELFLFDAVQQIFNMEEYFNDEYQKSDVQIGHTYFIRKDKINYLEIIIDRFIFQVIPILREYVKDGILDSYEDLISKEKSAADILAEESKEKRVIMAADTLMLFIKEFGNKTETGIVINNEYIANWIEDVNSKLYI